MKAYGSISIHNPLDGKLDSPTKGTLWECHRHLVELFVKRQTDIPVTFVRIVYQIR